MCRLILSGTSFDTISADEYFAEGVENINIQVGYDSDEDGVVNQYLSSPTTAQAQDAITVRIYVLVRSANEDPFYTNTKTYQLGDIMIDPNPDDGYYRRIYSTTVVLPNPKNMLTFR